MPFPLQRKSPLKLRVVAPRTNPLLHLALEPGPVPKITLLCSLPPPLPLLLEIPPWDCSSALLANMRTPNLGGMKPAKQQSDLYPLPLGQPSKGPTASLRYSLLFSKNSPRRNVVCSLASTSHPHSRYTSFNSRRAAHSLRSCSLR